MTRQRGRLKSLDSARPKIANAWNGSSLWPRWLAHGLIRGYQLSVSAFVGRQCRYLPSCSDYADEAIARHGVWPGGWMALARLCRCHPWGASGFDPVGPEQPLVPWYRPWAYGRWR